MVFEISCREETLSTDSTSRTGFVARSITGIRPMAEMTPNVLNGALDPLETLSRFLALLVITAKQASPLIALLVFNKEYRVNGSSDHAESVLQNIPMRVHVHFGFVLVQMEPLFALEIVEDPAANARVNVVVAE